jgi:hypothetical protein
MQEISSTESVLDDMQSRIRKLERWNTINMVVFYILSNTVHVLKFSSIIQSTDLGSINIMQIHISTGDQITFLMQVLWTILLSALVGYSFYQKRRH